MRKTFQVEVPSYGHIVWTRRQAHKHKDTHAGQTVRPSQTQAWRGNQGSYFADEGFCGRQPRHHVVKNRAVETL